MTADETPEERRARWKSVAVPRGAPLTPEASGVEMLERDDTGEVAGWVEDHGDHTETHLTPGGMPHMTPKARTPGDDL